MPTSVRAGRAGARVRAVTLAEAVISALLLAIVLGVTIYLFVGGSKLARLETEILGLQADAQRSLVQFLREIQESMEVVSPQPGHTLPYAVLRDKLNRMAVFSLVPGATKGLYDLRFNVASPGGVDRRILMAGVSRLTFTALSDSAIRIHMIIGTEPRRYPFYVEIRLRNHESAEF